MKLLAHRGFWKKKTDQNTLKAFRIAIDKGFGIELDIRDYNGNIIVSHDPFIGDKPLFFKDFIKHFHLELENVCLALNIKSDGLASKLIQLIDFRNYANIFCFDMSIPQYKEYETKGINVGHRLSEIEDLSLFDKSPKVVWIDSFDQVWYSEHDIIKLLNDNSKLCFVSEELHGRNPEYQWELLKKVYKKVSSKSDLKDKLFLCTDYFDEAKGYFDDD